MFNDPHTHGLWERTAPPAPTTAALDGEVIADVVVIGAGYTGLSTALHLRKHGASVVVVEAVEIGFGGSGRNVGLVNAGLWIKPDEVGHRLGKVYGQRLVKLLGHAPSIVFDLVATHAIQCEAMRAGTLHCGVGRQGSRELEQRAAQWHARGVSVQLLSAAETAARTGSRRFSGALFDARAGTIHPLGYARGLARAAIAGGTRIFTDSPALGFSAIPGGWRVSTPRGSVHAEWIVVATDAYSHGPWRTVRDEQVRLPYFNFATTPLDERARKWILPYGEGAWDTRRLLSSLRLDAGGRLLFGSIGALGRQGARVHEAWAKRALSQIFPTLGKITFEASWYGQIGMTHDNLPRFHVFAPKVIGFSGYNGRGIAPGTAFGQLLAQIITGNLKMEDLPLPITPSQTVVFRSLKERFYSFGSQVMHFAGARV